MQPTFKFQPMSFSWVAVHPQPKGVIQFIAGAFFGTFPTIFYRYFLNQLFDAGYTIVAIPFRFSFRHWSIAASLFVEQEALRNALIAATPDPAIQKIYQDAANYFWVGHSLGCKYIELLEFLSGDRWRTILQEATNPQEAARVQRVIESVTHGSTISIKGQASLLMAPDISNTENAIPIPALARLLDRIGLGVLPTREQTQRCIAHSNLFNLTALISFAQDVVAGRLQDKLGSRQVQEESDVLWLLQQLETKTCPILHQELPGRHLEPMGVQIGHWLVDLSPFQQRWLEQTALEFLEKLKQREAALKS